MKSVLFRGLFVAALFGLAFALPVSADVGDDTCLECHDGVQAAIARTSHTMTNRVSCEACHGAGDVHAEDPTPSNILSYRNSSAKQVMATCNQCHSGRHALKSSHLSYGRACLECHSLGHSTAFTDEGKRPERALLKDASSNLCTRCHAPVKAKMNRPFHHPSDDFDNVCLSCHNSHESRAELQRKVVDNKCGTCHPEAGGPFMYVHLGTQNNGCSECHDPHGSTNPNLLNRSTTRFLCLSCHSDTPDFHNMADPKFRQCTTCHSAIHGSNTNNLFME